MTTQKGQRNSGRDLRDLRNSGRDLRDLSYTESFKGHAKNFFG